MVQSDPDHEKFFFEQAVHELAKDRCSSSVGPDLLLGMICMLIYAVPKPHSEKLQLVNDHSVSCFSLNSMINHNEVTGYPMDNLARFGEQIIDQHKEKLDLVGPNTLIIWKSDVEGAYHLCPVHPYWQVKQAVQMSQLPY